MKRPAQITTLIAVALLTFAASALAQQPPKPQPPVRPPTEMTQDEPLPRPLKITFRYDPVEAQDTPCWVLAYVTRYAVEIHHEGKDTEYQLNVEGRVRPVEGKFLFTYNVQMHYLSADGSTFFKTDGSAQLTVGKEKKLTTFGERALVVLLSYDEGEQAEK